MTRWMLTYHNPKKDYSGFELKLKIHFDYVCKLTIDTTWIFVSDGTQTDADVMAIIDGMINKTSGKVALANLDNGIAYDVDKKTSPKWRSFVHISGHRWLVVKL